MVDACDGIPLSIACWRPSWPSRFGLSVKKKSNPRAWVLLAPASRLPKNYDAAVPMEILAFQIRREYCAGP